MRYFKLDLLTLLISLFIFSSCEKKGTIGLDIDPQDSIKTLVRDTFTVETVTVEEDSVVTSGIAQNAFGHIKDPVFGATNASLALNLSLPSDNYSFGTNPKLDSAVLVLKYGDEFFGDSLSSKYVINVHRLNTPYKTSVNFYSNQRIYNSSDTVIGSLNNVRKFLWNSTQPVRQIVRGGIDTIKNVEPQIRIPIKSGFINKLFLEAGSANLKNNAAFTNYIKGLYVSIDTTQSTGTGGIIFISLSSAISSLDIYYKKTVGTATDTSIASFKVTGASVINHNRTGTTVAAQLKDTTKSYPTVYVQPLAGVRTKIRFPYIKKLAAQGNISINKAELVIPIVGGTDLPLRAAPRLTLYRTDIAGQRQPVPDNALGVDPRFFGGAYNPTAKTYTFNITYYIQDLITKPIVQYDTFVAPIDLPLTQGPNIQPSAVTAARAILGGKGHPGSPIKLKITYTKPN